MVGLESGGNVGRLNSVSSVLLESKLVLPLVPALAWPLVTLELVVPFVVTLFVSNDKFLTSFELLLFGDNFLLSSVDASFDRNDNAEFC